MKLIFISIFGLSFLSIASAKQNNTGSAGGRYQIVQLSDYASHQYMIDTQTGKIWNKVCSVGNSTECEVAAWMPEDVVEVNISKKQYSAYIESYKKLKAENATTPAVGK